MVNNSTNINKMQTTSPHLKSLSTKNPRHMSIEITVLSLYSHKIWRVIDIGLVSFWMFNSCLSPLMLWVRILIRARCKTLCDKVCQWLATGRWFCMGTLVSSTNNKTDRHNITEILFKVALKPNIFQNLDLSKENHQSLLNNSKLLSCGVII